jgi:hypothetical protein
MSTIRRAPRRTKYAVIDNDTIRDERLTWKARGLLVYLLSLPDDWTVQQSDLVARAPDGRTVVRAALRELEQAGYLWREKRRGAHGHWIVESVVYERPDEGRKPPLDEGRFTTAENRPVSNTHLDEVPIANASRSRARSPRDDIFDALVDTFGPARGSRAAWYAKVAGELIKDWQATAEQVRERAEVLAAKDWPDAGPGALVKHWPDLDPAKPTRPRDRQAAARQQALDRVFGKEGDGERPGGQGALDAPSELADVRDE